MATGPERIIAGDIAHDAADTTTAQPIKIGGQAKSQDGTTPGTVAEDDRVAARFDRGGSLFVNIGHPYGFHTTVSYTAAQSTASIMATVSASDAIYVTDLVLSCDTTCNFLISSGSGVTAGATSHFAIDIAAGGGTLSHQFRSPLKINVGHDLLLTTDASNTAFNVSGYIGP